MQVVPHPDDAIFFLLRAAWQEYMSIGKCLCLFIVEGMAGPYTGLALQATIRQPTTTNIYKALGMQFTVGTFPFLVLTFVGYWAYGNTANPYLLLSLGGPKSLVTIANAAAFLQAIVSLHVSSHPSQRPKLFVFAYIDGILSACCLSAKNLDFLKTEELSGFIQIYATPMYEFMDTHFARKDQGDWSAHSMLVRLITRGTYITISTFLGALLPFFGDFITLTGAMAAFPLESGIIHHMYLKVSFLFLQNSIHSHTFFSPKATLQSLSLCATTIFHNSVTNIPHCWDKSAVK